MNEFTYNVINFNINSRPSCYNIGCNIIGCNKVTDDYIVHNIINYPRIDCESDIVSILNRFKNTITSTLQEHIHWRYNEEAEKVYDKTEIKVIELNEITGKSVFIYLPPTEDDENKVALMIKITSTGTIYSMEELSLVLHMLDTKLVRYTPIRFKSDGTIYFDGMIENENDN